MTIQDFIDGKVAVWCKDADEAEDLLKLCEKSGLITTAAGWSFPESELPVEIACGYYHPNVLAFVNTFGLHHCLADEKWAPVVAGEFFEKVKGGCR